MDEIGDPAVTEHSAGRSVDRRRFLPGGALRIYSVAFAGSIAASERASAAVSGETARTLAGCPGVCADTVPSGESWSVGKCAGSHEPIAVRISGEESSALRRLSIIAAAEGFAEDAPSSIC